MGRTASLHHPYITAEGLRHWSIGGAASYSSSVTCSPHVTGLHWSSTSCIAMWVMKRLGAAPCQWSSQGFEEHAIARAYHLDWPAADLRSATSFIGQGCAHPQAVPAWPCGDQHKRLVESLPP